jgi:transcriptional regulator
MNAAELIKLIKYKGQLSQTEIANEVGCTQVTISRLKRNCCIPNYKNATNLILLAKRYNIKVTLTDLLPLD